MFQFEKFSSLFNCQQCQKVLGDPVFLPCGETVCRIHTEEIDQVGCIFCSEMHKAPQNGFPANKMVQNQLELNANKMNQNFSQFNDYKKIIQGLNNKLKAAESILQDPDNYIYEYFNELIRQVDLRRESLFEQVQQSSSKLIEEIEKLKADCMSKSKKATKTIETIDSIKAKLDHLHSMFGSIEMDDLKLEQILSKKRSKEVSELLEPVLEKYKLELQGNKEYTLTKSEIKIEFGSLNAVNFEIRKVSIILLIM